MAIWESNRAFLENVQIDLEMVAWCTIQLAAPPRIPVSKRCPLFVKLLFRIFSVLTVLTARLCLSFNPHITLWSWLWGEKLSTFLKKPASPKLFDGFIICRETHHRAAKKKNQGELWASCGDRLFWAQVPSFCWRVLCAKRKNITRHTSQQKEIDYVKKERSSNRKYVWKRK